MVFTGNKRMTKAVAAFTAILLTVLAIIPSGFSLAAKTVYASAGNSGTTNTVDGDHFYDFRDGSIIPTTTDGKSDVTYETLTVKVGNQNAYGYNGNQHGMEFKAGNSIELAVNGPTKVTVGDCQYSNMTSLTLTSSDGSYSETQAAKTGCYHNDGSAMVFTYTGEAATTLTMTMTDKIYMPCIEVESLHKVYNFRDGSVIPTTTDGKSDVEYGSLKVKVGNQNAYGYNGNQHGMEFKAGNSIELAVNGPTKVTVGDCLYSNMASLTLTSSDGSYSETVSSKTGCYHNDGSAVEFKYLSDTPTTLTLSFTDKVYVPEIVMDTIMEEQPDDNGVKKDTVEMYNFADGSVVSAEYDAANPLTGDITKDNLTVTGNGDLYMHDTQHGLAIYNGNKFEVKVAGDATVTFNLCQYGGDATAKIKASSKKGEFTSEKEQLLIDGKNDGLSSVAFNYKGVATTLTFTVVTSAQENEMYLHGINVSNLPEASETPELVSDGRVDVWDFGAEQLDSAKYNNKLSVDIMNSWYGKDIVPGSEGQTIGSFATDEFFFNPAGRTNNRIRTSNTAITRYDARTDKVIDGTTLTGYLYSNNASPVVYAGIKLYKNDILTLYTGSNSGASTIYCESPSGIIQEAQSSVDGVKLTFYALEYGVYKIYSTNEKLVIYRALREHTQPVVVSGAVDLTAAAGIEDKDYRILISNMETGEEIEAAVEGGRYSTYLYEGYHYKMSLKDANGYVIKSTTDIDLVKGTGNKDIPVVIEKVDLVTVTGEFTGLTEAEAAKMELSFVNTDKVYVPEFTVTGTTFTVFLERGVEYSIAAEGINDFYLSDITKLCAVENGTKNIAFTAKPVYTVYTTLAGLPVEMIADAEVTFTNINEPEYSYTFKGDAKMQLRDGQYKVKVTNIASQPFVQKITSDVKVDGMPVSKTIEFDTMSQWDFSKLNGNPGVETIGETPYYSGLKLKNALENKIYLLLLADGTIEVPVKKNDIVTLQYCYCSAFNINGEVTVETNSGSTTTIETTVYTAKEDGVVTLAGTGQTYFTSISVSTPAAYSEKVTVGADKQYQTINAALDAVAMMNRPNNERVEIVIDPGNYEEMLVINLENVSLVNAAGENSSIELTNKGVDITDNAVRITSYYGHGYNYYSMGSDCKYDADILAANQENGYLSTTNPGSGTTNGSYWNATVVVYANGFEADGIIFENSFNQYISAKEAADTVVMWETGSKGERPTTVGDTSVQQKEFVERAAAMAVVGDKSVFNNCKFIGRQDTLYGGQNIDSVYQNCNILGGTDYIFGGMRAVFYQCKLTMNTENTNSNDVAYITAAQQSAGRGYLMYNCTVTSTTPGVDTASEYRSKQGYFGRPWAANTSEVVYYNTVVETTDDPATPGQSLIKAEGWNSSLGGESVKMYEFATKELSGQNNAADRAGWATTLTEAKLSDGTDISIAAFLGDWAAQLQARGLVKELNFVEPGVPEITEEPSKPEQPDVPGDLEDGSNGEAYQPKDEAQTPATDVPTGDGSLAVWYVILALMAVLAVIGIVYAERKKRA
ncbi:MAG: pectinesterase family protein [Eubacteriales bacterium]|nr:pectinesterase family protein [Eubacteriales bacterium]